MILPAPMLLHEGRKPHPFHQACWLYELKHDGYRLIAGVDRGRVVLNTRNGADATKWFPEVVDGLASISGGPHVMDGEVCVLDDIGDRCSIGCRIAHAAGAGMRAAMR